MVIFLDPNYRRKRIVEEKLAAKKQCIENMCTFKYDELINATISEILPEISEAAISSRYDEIALQEKETSKNNDTIEIMLKKSSYISAIGNELQDELIKEIISDEYIKAKTRQKMMNETYTLITGEIFSELLLPKLQVIVSTAKNEKDFNSVDTSAENSDFEIPGLDGDVDQSSFNDISSEAEDLPPMPTPDFDILGRDPENEILRKGLVFYFCFISKVFLKKSLKTIQGVHETKSHH